MTLRPSTNLIVPPHLTLPKKELKTKFLYVYNRGFQGSPVIFLTKLWASTFFPSVAHDPQFGVGKSKVRIGDALQQVTPASFLRVKVVHDGQDSHVLASIPVYSFNVGEPTAVFRFLHEQFISKSRLVVPPQPNVRQISEIEALKSHFENHDSKVPRDLVFHPNNVLRAAKHLDQHAISHLKSTLQCMRIQTKGNLAVVFFDLKITKEEAQQLTTTEWQQMRDIDVYPLLLQWVSTSYGERGLAPIASFPISKIAMTLPKSHVEAARVNEHGLSIGPNGRPYYLPREIDEKQTIEYEDLYTQAGTRADGSYALTDINEGAAALESKTEVKVKLPKNVPVLIDWVNNKYSYTDTHGLLKVHDLMRYRAAEPTHIRILLAERYVNEDHINLWTSMGKSAGVFATEFWPTEKDLDGMNLSSLFRSSFNSARTPIDWFGVASGYYEYMTEETKIPFKELNSNGLGPFRPLARFFKIVAKACLANLPAVYREYSVRTVMENLSWLVMLAEYADNMAELEAKDLEVRGPALGQGLDPSWVAPPIPMIDALREIGYLPHQHKVRNLLRHSPMLAIMPVQAGGGKSLLLITDILYEIMYGRSHPFILLCPGHLIANYVNEVLYFTGGQLNVIPINGTIIREHGFERLQKIVEAMPRNTVIVCDYDTLRYKQRAICYGTTPVTIYPVIDFLRQFNFGYAGLDESHKVKNETARTKATMCLITDIPKIRLASGTMAHDSPSDLAMQVAALDPTLFGTRNEFNAKYGMSWSGGRVMHWRPGAQEQIRRKINSRVVTAGAMRKEWAAFLPTKREWIGGVNLTSAQQLVYNAILDETLEKIEEDAKSNKELQKFFGKRRPAIKPDEDVEDDEDDIRDEDAGSDLAALLKPYLARLERFLMAPSKDPLGNKLLINEADRVSPKVTAIIERIRLHLFGEVRDKKTGEFEKVFEPLPGKVLIFTNNIVSAEEVFEIAGPELRKCGLLYKAENKMEHGARFEKMDRIRWMVGVEQSMNEGLNFQFVGRTIRPETVWNPGTLEQGNSRTNRPELKKKELRKEVFYDTLVVNRTIDITKAARLISKIIAVAKFENSSDPEFEKIPDVPIIKMSLGSIRTFNTWEYVNKEQPGLASYAAALAEYERVREKDYSEYKQNYIAMYGEGPIKTALTIAKTPADARFLSRVPYAPGGEIFGKTVLDAVRIDEYLNLIEDELLLDNQDEEEPEEEEDDSDFSPLAQKAASLHGRTVHTEYGEGTISRCGVKMKYVSVRLHNGYTVRVRKSACFLLNKDVGQDVRHEIASLIDMVVTEVEEVPALAYKLSREQSKTKKVREAKAAQKAQKIRERETRKALTLDLNLIVSNGYLGLSYAITHNVTALQTLQACGFRSAPAFYALRVPTAIGLVRVRDAWSAAGMAVDKKHSRAGSRAWFSEMYEQLRSGTIDNVQSSVRGSANAKMPNFYRLKHLASKEKLVIRPYAVIENGDAYVVFPKEGQSWTKRAIRSSPNALKWIEGPATLTYFGTVEQIRQMAKRVKESGVTVRNADALNRQFQSVSNLKVRVQN